jgi:hypothetical protein
MGEYRAYSWEGDYRAVKATVAKELRSLGYTLATDKREYSIWNNGNARTIWIQYGLSLTRKEALGGTAKRPGITIVVWEEAPETLINKFRAYIEPDI